MRLLDQFRAELDRRGLSMPGDLHECGIFGDLNWPPFGERGYVMSRITEDPAFEITGHTRRVALAWIVDEIRFFAARIEPGTQSWWWSGEQPERVAAINAESEDSEMAVFENITDAVTFTVLYLGGSALGDIEVTRIKPTPERYGIRRP